MLSKSLSSGSNAFQLAIPSLNSYTGEREISLFNYHEGRLNYLGSVSYEIYRDSPVKNNYQFNYDYYLSLD